MDDTLQVELSMRAGDGTVLSATNDLDLARAWAEHVYGPDWSRLSTGRRCSEVAAALAEIKAAVHRAPRPDAMLRREPGGRW